MEMTELIETRRTLTDALADCEPGCFPGSAEYRKEAAAMAALAEFDAEHPEVLAEINKRHAANVNANPWM